MARMTSQCTGINNKVECTGNIGRKTDAEIPVRKW